jgi:hypothetical protein
MSLGKFIQAATERRAAQKEKAEGKRSNRKTKRQALKEIRQDKSQDKDTKRKKIRATKAYHRTDPKTGKPVGWSGVFKAGQRITKRAERKAAVKERIAKRKEARKGGE